MWDKWVVWSSPFGGGGGGPGPSWPGLMATELIVCLSVSSKMGFPIIIFGCQIRSTQISNSNRSAGFFDPLMLIYVIIIFINIYWGMLGGIPQVFST